MEAKYYNAKYDAWIIFYDEDFLIVNDHEGITDNDIECLHDGKKTKGWEILTTDDDKYYIDVLTN